MKPSSWRDYKYDLKKALTADTGITITRSSNNAAYITFKRTGLVIYVDDSTEEEIVSMWNEKDNNAFPPANLEYVAGHDEEGNAYRFKPNPWKKEA
tara:strand:+ start:3859 stop:4146 length:288 start_codon:yes stop_codon:yes gene_type:complete